jgi:hypothetical protein
MLHRVTRNGGPDMTDVAGIITATGGVIALLIKVASMQPKRRKAADVTDRLGALEERLQTAEDRLLGWAAWAHDARVTSAAAGVRLPAIPARLLAGDDAPTVPAPRVATDG